MAKYFLEWYFKKEQITIIIIHCSHFISCDWPGAYSQLHLTIMQLTHKTVICVTASRELSYV